MEGIVVCGIKNTIRLVCVILFSLILYACGHGGGNNDTTATTQTSEQSSSGLQFQASVANTNIAFIVLEVTAPDIPEPLIFNLNRNGDVIEGIIHVAAGSDRHILVRAFDENGVETHQGETVITVQPGMNPTVFITLYPLIGDVPINVTIENIIISILPVETNLNVGDTLQLEATITDGNGMNIPGNISWGSTVPFVASVSDGGLVTALHKGTTEIVANYGNVRASIELTVGSGGGPSTGEVQGPVYPPPGGVTLNTSGQLGSGLGVFFYFTDFDLSQVNALAWGVDSNEPIQLAMDGTVDASGETLQFNAMDSDFANGVMRWTGSAEFTYQDPVTMNFTTVTLDTRLTVHVYDNSSDITISAATDAGLPEEIGGLAPVNENYPTGGTNSPMTVNLLMEAFFEGAWQPVDDVFSSRNTPESSSVITSFGGGFYYLPLDSQPPGGGQVLGPVIDPPGGVSLVTDGIPGVGNGFFYRYSNFDLSAVSALAWGTWLGETNSFAFDGAVDSPGELLTYSEAESDLANGMMRWVGEAELTYLDAGMTATVTVPTRLTVTISNAMGAVELVPATEAGLPGDIGAIAPVTDDYVSGGSNGEFTVNLLMEANFNGTWQPALDLYNSLDTAGDSSVVTSFYNGFYYVE